MTSIRTERLDLVALDVDFLYASLAGDRERAEARIGLALPADWPADRGVFEMRLEQLRRDPGWAPWLTRVIGLRAERRAIGVIGFHGPPGGDWLKDFAPGGLEFGYTVDPSWRRRGVAFEASRALMDWAIREAGDVPFVLSIAATNGASLSLAAKLGFARVGTWHHPVRGDEEVYRRGPGRGADSA